MHPHRAQGFCHHQCPTTCHHHDNQVKPSQITLSFPKKSLSCVRTMPHDTGNHTKSHPSPQNHKHQPANGSLPTTVDCQPPTSAHANQLLHSRSHLSFLHHKFMSRLSLVPIHNPGTQQFCSRFAGIEPPRPHGTPSHRSQHQAVCIFRVTTNQHLTGKDQVPPPHFWFQ